MSEKSQEFPQSGQLVGHLLVQMASSNESEIFTVMLDKSRGGYKGSISGFPWKINRENGFFYNTSKKIVPTK